MSKQTKQNKEEKKYKSIFYFQDVMVNDYRTVMLPTIDTIASDTFEYRRPKIGYAGRGAFNWYFKYQLIPLLPSAFAKPSKPFGTPVMAGGLFAIHAKFFWELGAYDDGLDTYGKND